MSEGPPPPILRIQIQSPRRISLVVLLSRTNRVSAQDPKNRSIWGLSCFEGKAVSKGSQNENHHVERSANRRTLISEKEIPL